MISDYNVSQHARCPIDIDQCDISTGIPLCLSISLVVPPNSLSRKRDRPYAPITINSAPSSSACVCITEDML